MYKRNKVSLKSTWLLLAVVTVPLVLVGPVVARAVSIEVDSPDAPFVNAEGVHLVTSDSAPSAAEFTGTGAVSGDYRWALSSCGAIDSPTADAIVYTAPEAIDEDTCEDTLILTSAAQPDDLTDTIKITVYHPLSITWPPGKAGIALDDDDQTVTASGGSGAYAFQSSDEGVATVNEDGDITPVGLGTFTVKVRDDAFGDFGTENGFLAETPQIEVINTIVIGNKPPDGSLLSEGENQFSVSGGKDEGQVYWETVYGTMDADGHYTAPTVLTVSGNFVTETITAYDQTYNKNHPTPVKTAYTLIIYPNLSIVPPGDFDAEEPLLPGDEITLTGRGGDWECTWTVDGPEDVDGATDCDYTFVAPSEGEFAGVYDVVLSDGSGYTSALGVKVAMEIMPGALSFTEATIDGDPNPQLLEASGGSAADYTWEILENPDDADPAEDQAAFGTWTQDGPVTGDNTNTFNPGDADEVMTFYVRVTVENDPDLTEENGLNKVVGGPYRVIPIRTLAGTVVDEGNVAIDGAMVEVRAPADWAAETQTDGFGEFAFNLPDSGTTYRMTADKGGYVATDFTSHDLADDDGQNNPVQLITAAADAYISGTVTVDNEPPASVVNVRVYHDLDGLPVLAGAVKTMGTFRFDFEANSFPYTLTASTVGFVATMSVTGPFPVEDIQLDLEPTTLLTCVDAVGGGTMDFAEVPLGVVDTSDGADEVCFDFTTQEDAWACGQGGDMVYYEITAVDQIQRPVIFTGDASMSVTLPFDLLQVPPGGFENGEFAVYQADSLDNCNDLEVLAPDRIVAADYVGDGMTGSVTFLVSHLSDFGIGERRGDDEGGLGGSSDSRCFVATAAYGSPLDSHVKVLRQFRDIYLLPTRAGRALVDAYYSLSPPAAEFISNHGYLKALTRFALLPVVGLSFVMLHMGFFGSLLALAAVFLMWLGLWKIGCGQRRRAALMAVPFMLAYPMAAGAAEAKEKTRYYGALYGVYAFEAIDEGDTEDKFDIPINLNYDDSMGVQARMGYIYNKYLSVEGMFEYIVPFEADDGDADTELDVLNFTVNGKLTSPNYDAFVPYVMVGVGVMNAYEDISFRGKSSEDSDWGFGARAGFGFDHYMNQNWSVGLEGAYVFGTGAVDNIQYVTVALGVGYHW